MSSVSQRIKKYNTGLLPEMIDLKYRFMAENIFRFYRGTCHLFYEDLSKHKNFSQAPLSWICGDLHLENFGSFKADNRLVHFDLNDFDEAILAPASWEILRLVTSILIAFDHLEIDKIKAHKMAQLFLKSYAATLSKGKAYYIETKTAKGIVATFLKKAGKKKKRALLDKRTNIRQNQLTIMMEDPRHFEIDFGLKQRLTDHITKWISNSSDGPYNYHVCDVAFRLAGTGSVGLKRYAFLLKGKRDPNKFLLVEMKQARPSSLAPYVKVPQPQWTSEAERIVSIQQRMQNIPPALLSHTMFDSEPFLIQEMQLVKDSINFNLIRDRYRDMYKVIDDMAMLTASSQLRCSGRQGSAIADDLIAFGQNCEWQEQTLNYAIKYAGKVKAYYASYLEDYKKGFFQQP